MARPGSAARPSVLATGRSSTTKAAVRTRTRVPGPSRVAVGSTQVGAGHQPGADVRPLAVLRLPSVAIDSARWARWLLRFGWCASTQGPAAENSCSGDARQRLAPDPGRLAPPACSGSRHCRRWWAAGCSRPGAAPPRWGADAVPDERQAQGLAPDAAAGQLHPVARRQVAAVASRARLRQARAALRPSLLSLPSRLSTWKRRTGGWSSGHAAASGGCKWHQQHGRRNTTRFAQRQRQRVVHGGRRSAALRPGPRPWGRPGGGIDNVGRATGAGCQQAGQQGQHGRPGRKAVGCGQGAGAGMRHDRNGNAADVGAPCTDLSVAAPLTGQSRALATRSPARCTRPSRRALRSCSTISRTRSSKPTSGAQPSTWRARVASPSKVSTSAGRK
jgi:hypothetical protein